MCFENAGTQVALLEVRIFSSEMSDVKNNPFNNAMSDENIILEGEPDQYQYDQYGRETGIVSLHSERYEMRGRLMRSKE